MAVRPEIQAVADAVNSLKDPVAKLEAAQTDELQKIADLTAKVAAGQALTDEEKTALSDSVTSLQSIAAGVVAALPAATQATQAATSGG